MGDRRGQHRPREIACRGGGAQGWVLHPHHPRRQGQGQGGGAHPEGEPLGQVGYSIHTTRDRVRVEELILRESPWAR
jgi:hypothetical protein